VLGAFAASHAATTLAAGGGRSLISHSNSASGDSSASAPTRTSRHLWAIGDDKVLSLSVILITMAGPVMWEGIGGGADWFAPHKANLKAPQAPAAVLPMCTASGPPFLPFLLLRRIIFCKYSSAYEEK
jgi:hypothetical protein